MSENNSQDEEKTVNTYSPYKRYNPVGRTLRFTEQLCKSVRGMYERGYNDGKNDTIETDRMEAGKLTEDTAIKLLQLSGWMENHDKEITESEYKRGFEDGRKSNEVIISQDGTFSVPSQSVLGAAAAAIVDDKMGYKHGYEEGKKECEKEYQRGLDDMQNALLAIDKWNNDHKALVFHGSLGSIAILRDHTSKYIVDQVRRYQEEQAAQAAEIKVGDEVIYYGTKERGIVTKVFETDKTYYRCVRHDGELSTENSGHPPIKTGRHFTQIAELLDNLKGGAE